MTKQSHGLHRRPETAKAYCERLLASVYSRHTQSPFYHLLAGLYRYWMQRREESNEENDLLLNMANEVSWQLATSKKV